MNRALCPAYGRRVTSSRLEPPTHTTGAHRGQRRTPHPSPQRPPARYEPYLDGLFTYCLSVLCDHDAATDALGGVLAIAERQDGRCPEGEEERKSWLYALARWMCLRRLAEQKQGRQAHRRPAGRRAAGAPGKRGGTAAQGARGPRRTPPTAAATAGTSTATALNTPVAPAPAAPAPASTAPGTATTPGAAAAPALTLDAATEAHRRELAQLAWPEAAGTTPEQREALELAVRHRLAPRGVAAVLGLEPATARELLSAAACEVERTRAALAVVESGTCPGVARLSADNRLLLSAPLRRELVRHVDECPRCRRAAERAGADGPWPGAAVGPATVLPVVPAPRPSAYVALRRAQRNRSGGPRFDRAGFPMDPKDHAARRDRLRARVVTTTVVATVVAAPVIALWTAYRGAPQTGEGHDGATIAATGTDDRRGLEDDPYGHYENAGNARPEAGGGFADGGRAPDVSAEVVGAGRSGAGGLVVEVRSSGSTTLVTLAATGGAPVAWHARTSASWLRPSLSAGTLAPGRSVTIRVFVDRAREPAGPWSAQLALTPSGSVVAIRGHGSATPSHGPSAPPGTSGPSHPSSPSPSPGVPTRSPDPTPDPTDPSPSPTDPEPTDPDPSGTTDPTPSPTDPGTDPAGSATP